MVWKLRKYCGFAWDWPVQEDEEGSRCLSLSLSLFHSLSLSECLPAAEGMQTILQMRQNLCLWEEEEEEESPLWHIQQLLPNLA
jgi:hypothetical protein